jgi:ribosomal protein S18 acetylase RimI-like enzyme
MYRVRPCEPDDLPAVIRLSQAWAEERITNGYENVNWTEERLASKLGSYFLVAELGDRIAGYTFGTVKTSGGSSVMATGENYLEIYEVYVDKEIRSAGLGRSLVRALIEKAESEGVTRVTVGSSNTNWRETAQFYEKLGFGMWYFQMIK